MNRLDKISHYLSYTDFVPLISIPSGIVHLICAIRDQVFLQPPFVPARETLIQLSKRKLDNWSNLSKGVLALIPIIGNAVLFGKWVQRALTSRVISQYNRGIPPAQFNKIPAFLIEDASFLRLLPQNYNRPNVQGANDILFSRTSLANRNDALLVEELINGDIITCDSYPHLSLPLQGDARILDAYTLQVTRFCNLLPEGPTSSSTTPFFDNLHQNLKNHAGIAQAIANHVAQYPDRVGRIVNSITNPDTRLSSPTLISGALYNGQILFKDLPNVQITSDMAIAALRHDFNQWEDLPQMQKVDTRVMGAYRQHRELKIQAKLREGKVLFKNIPLELQTENTARTALTFDINQWKDIPDKLKSHALRNYYGVRLRISATP